jgi:small-conductance mechanosensitive channel/CRP-like cAMP-binding protein
MNALGWLRDLTPEAWAKALMVAFPFVFVLLGEIADRLATRRSPVRHPVRSLRNFVLPLLVAIVTSRFVARSEPGSIGIKVLETLFWVALVFVTISFINALLFDESAGISDSNWRANVPTLLRNMSRGVLVMLGLAVVVSSVWDVDLKGALAALGVGSIVLGFALQGTLGGIVSGIALLIDRPFREGDFVRVGDITGVVKEMNWRSVRIQTFSSDLVIIPNSQLAEESLVNLSRPKSWHLEMFELGFSYNDPPAGVKSMLLEVAHQCQHALTEPAPRVRVKEYSDFSINYEVRIAVFVEHVFEARDEFMTRIWYATQRHGYSIPFPTQVELQSDAVEAQSRKRQDELAEEREVLNGALTLEAPVIESILQTAVRKEYTANEYVLREGATARALYFVIAGKGALGLVGHDKSFVHVGELGRGDIFGAGNLLRGEPSALSFRAVTDLRLVELPAKFVFDIIKDHPRFAVELQRLMAQRQKLASDAREAHAPQSHRAQGSTLQEWMTRALARAEPTGGKAHDSVSGPESSNDDAHLGL